MHRVRNTIYFNATEAFEDLYSEIMARGVETKGTKALYNVGFFLVDPKKREITTPWRKWTPDYAEREWQWYLSGNRSVEELKKHAKIWDKMHNGDNIVNSNYGWQWMRNGQLAKCIEQLRTEPDTRQAWISLFDGKEKDDYKFDTPCTMAIGFDRSPVSNLVSNLHQYSYLNMTVMMRSNDLVYGFCNDQYCFSKLQELVAKELGLKIGTYYHFAHNMHIYQRHFDLKERNS